MLVPGAAVQQLDIDRDAEEVADRPGCIVGIDRRAAIHHEMPQVVLHDQRAGRKVVVPALADRDRIEQLIRPEEGLVDLPDAALAFELDAELLAHRARATVAADEISGAHRLVAGETTDTPSASCVKDEQFTAEAHRDVRHLLGDRFQQRLERVLRDDLIGLERQGAIVEACDLGLAGRDRRIGQMQDRRIDKAGDDEDVHRHVAEAAGRAYFLGQPHAAEDLHGARVAALHLGPLPAGRRCARRACTVTPRRARSIARVRPTGPAADDQHIGIVRVVHRFVSLPGARMLSQFENHPKDTGLTTSSDGD